MWFNTIVKMNYVIAPALFGLICAWVSFTLFEWYKARRSEAMWMYTQPKFYYIADRQMKFAMTYLKLTVALTIISIASFVLSGVVLINWIW